MDEIIINENPMNESPRYSEAVIRRAPLMAKWLWVLFWANIVSIVINIIKIESSGIYTTIQTILTFICALSMCFCLSKMRGEDNRYGLAALFQLIAMVLNSGIPLIFGPIANKFLTIIIALAAAVLALLSVYYEYHAHSCIVGGLNSDLGDRWQKLWIWKIYAIAAAFAIIFVVAISVVLGAICTIALAIFTLVVEIMVLVNLYRSAQAYRAVVSYTQENE